MRLEAAHFDPARYRGGSRYVLIQQDEFYTQYVDIQKEIEAYLEFDPGRLRGVQAPVQRLACFSIALNRGSERRSSTSGKTAR